MSTTTGTGRALRCLRLVEHVNGLKMRPTEQCPNERLEGSDECAHHLAVAAATFRQITEAHAALRGAA